MGLDGLLRARRNDLTGIVQGKFLDTWNGMLWGCGEDDGRVWAYDGDQVLQGARVPENLGTISGIWGTDSGLFLAARNPVLQVDPGAAGIGWMWPHTVICKSDDGFSDFRPVLPYARASIPMPVLSSLPRSFVDLGGGQMLYLDYCGSCRIFHSGDGGENWNMIMDLRAQINPNMGDNEKPITHFHGAVYDDNHQTLYVMTGDPDPRSSTLICNDLYGPDGLIQNPDLWQSRWGLLHSDRHTLDPDYALRFPDGTWASQAFRAVDLIINGDVLTWGTDNGETPYLMRADRTTSIAEVPETSIEMKGPTYHAMKTEDGHVLLFTASTYNLDLETYLANQDEYFRMYWVTPDGSDVELMNEWLRCDAADPDRVLAKVWGFTEAFGHIWLAGDFTADGDVLVGQIAPEPAALLLLAAGLLALRARRG
jgi:hypothetical protein